MVSSRASSCTSLGEASVSSSVGSKNCGRRPGHVRESSAPERSRRRGGLAKDFESRFSSLAKENLPASIDRRQRKPRTITFTDPRNPFDRHLAKATVRLEEWRKDMDRAGSRTQKPGDNLGDRTMELLRADGIEHRCVPHRFSLRPHNRGSEDDKSLLAPLQRGSVLDNYLNDMKKCTSAVRRVATVSREGEIEKMAGGCSLAFHESSAKAVPERRCGRGMVRSVSCEPGSTKEAEWENVHGFPRYGKVMGAWTRSSSHDMLHHVNDEKPARTPRTARVARDDMRFEEIVQHMSNHFSERRTASADVRTRSQAGTGVSCVMDAQA